MGPVPSDEEKEELRRKHWLESGHAERGPDRHWRLDHPRLWENICSDFHGDLLDTGGQRTLPIVQDAEDHVCWLKAGIKLARVASRNGARRDIEALWNWNKGVSKENGGTELLREGLFHADKLRLCLEWLDHQRFHEKKTHLRVPARLGSFINITLGAVIYETVVLCGVRFLEGLAACALHEEFEPYSKLFENQSQVHTSQVNQAVSRAKEKVKELTYRPGLTKEDISNLKEFLDHLNQQRVSKGRAPTDVRYVRDSAHHGKFVIDEEGFFFFDIYAHLLVNRFLDPERYGKRGRTVHPYEYRTLDVEAAEQFLTVACSSAPIFYALHRELFWIEREGATQMKHPPSSLLNDAEQRIDEWKLPPSEKKEKLKEEREQRTGGRVEVTDVEVVDPNGEVDEEGEDA